MYLTQGPYFTDTFYQLKQKHKNFDDLFGSDSEFTETEDCKKKMNFLPWFLFLVSDRSGEKEADTGFFEGSTKSDCDAKSEIIEEKEIVVKIK